LDAFNQFLEVLINRLLDALPPCKKVNHKIKMVPGLTPPSYRLNQKDLEEFLKKLTTSLIESISGKTSCLMGH
jgi:hypothetical protein